MNKIHLISTEERSYFADLDTQQIYDKISRTGDSGAISRSFVGAMILGTIIYAIAVVFTDALDQAYTPISTYLFNSILLFILIGMVFGFCLKVFRGINSVENSKPVSLNKEYERNLLKKVIKIEILKLILILPFLIGNFVLAVYFIQSSRTILLLIIGILAFPLIFFLLSTKLTFIKIRFCRKVLALDIRKETKHD